MNRVAAIQMTSGPEVSTNLQAAKDLITRAAVQDAKLVVLPENFALMGKTEQDKLRISEREGSGVIQDFLSQQAALHSMWIVGGTIPFTAADKTEGGGKVRAACLLFDAQGNLSARYDKIHLFDVSLVDSREDYLESQTITPGDTIVVHETPYGRIGIAVCYDLRFPELFRQMLVKDVEIIVLPAAFTATTGEAHWEILVRARAIENLCYVIASAQGGHHSNGRETYGDSMIVDPWGIVLDRCAPGPGVAIAAIDRDQMAQIRRNFPAIEHRKVRTHLHNSND
jgi:deaminated glutathione amidase